MDRALTWFIRVWVGIVILVNLIAMIGFFVGAPSLWAGWQRIANVYGPFNWPNYLAEVIFLSPALGAIAWRDRRRKAGESRVRSMSAQEVQQIINAYGAATEKPEPFPRELRPWPEISEGRIPQKTLDEYRTIVAGDRLTVHDATRLPYPKERIKQALLTAIILTPPGPAREQLKTGFVMLGNWQDPNTQDPVTASLAEGVALSSELRSRGL